MPKNKNENPIKNNKGQGLVEYMVLVAIIAIGTVAVVRTLGSNISANYANISNALTGNTSTKISRTPINEDDTAVKKKKFSDFMDGVATK